MSTTRCASRLLFILLLATAIMAQTIVEKDERVGIGTTAPSGRLHIIGSDDMAGTLRLQPNPQKGTYQSHVHWGPNGDWYIRSARDSGHVVLQDTGGTVGIGTAGTSSKLTIEGQNALAVQGFEPFVTLVDSTTSDFFSYRIQSAHGDLNFFQGKRNPGQVTTNWTPLLIVKDTGNVGIGAPLPQARLHVAGPFLRVDGAASEQAYLGGDGSGGDVQLGSSNPNISTVALWNSASGTHMNLFVRGITITGGADFAENFDVTSTANGQAVIAPGVEAGMVVAIDPDRPGKLVLSTQPYDRRVAGVISGAGGVRPGMTLSHGTVIDGQFPVALSGRVYCWAETSQGAIEPGDLLTTSSVPGYAMRAADLARAQGAVLGKAMTGLKGDQGLVLVLVTLQ